MLWILIVLVHIAMLLSGVMLITTVFVFVEGLKNILGYAILGIGLIIITLLSIAFLINSLPK